MTISKEQNFTKKIFTTKDYVQDGLIAIWDGIESARGKDKWYSVDGQYGINVSVKSSFGQDCFVNFDYGHYDGLNDAQKKVILESDGFTIDVLVGPNLSKNDAFAQVYGPVSGSDIAFTSITFRTSDNRMIFNHMSYFVNRVMPECATGVNQFAISVSKSDWTRSGFINGNLILQSKSFFQDCDGVKNSYMAANGTQYFRYAVYSRALSPEEIAHNYKIDERRFI